MKLPQNITAKLKKRIDDNAYRSLVDFTGKRKNGEYWIDFFSNDYLGLARVDFDELHSNGATGSRLISGNTGYTQQLEKKLAFFLNQPAGLIFNSGFDANLGIFSSIPQRGDTIIYDELCHASIRDGIRLSFANSFAFKHNDLEHLKQRLKQAKGNVYVTIESIYSMDGDEALLTEIVQLCQIYNAFLIVDEAHSAGLYGEKGKGLVNKYGLDDKIFIKLITFGKAYGSHGAIVLSQQRVIEFLINFARSFIYTTALPKHSLKRIEQVVELSKIMDNVRLNLFNLIAYFKQKAREQKIQLIESYSPIQSIVISGNDNVKLVEKHLQKHGFAVKAILSPTVPKGKERIRICLHAHNMKNDIDKLFECLIPIKHSLYVT
jgi:8-amino-7-oxononanoate synthase